MDCHKIGLKNSRSSENIELKIQELAAIIKITLVWLQFLYRTKQNKLHTVFFLTLIAKRPNSGQLTDNLNTDIKKASIYTKRIHIFSTKKKSLV